MRIERGYRLHQDRKLVFVSRHSQKTGTIFLSLKQGKTPSELQWICGKTFLLNCNLNGYKIATTLLVSVYLEGHMNHLDSLVLNNMSFTISLFPKVAFH